MTSKIWIKWLSVISLILIGSSTIIKIWDFFLGGVVSFDITELTILILAIISVLIAFGKK